MSTQGILVIDLLGIVFLLLIVNLVRTQRLAVGYAVVWALASCGVLLLVSVRPLLSLLTRAVGALFPASALSLLAFAFIFGVLILFSVKLSSLSARQTELIQALALKELLSEEDVEEMIGTKAEIETEPRADGEP